MSARLVTVAAILLAHASIAVAQEEDDLLAPLTPVDKQKKKKKEKDPGKKEPPKPVAPKEEPQVAKLLVKLPDALAGVVSNAKVLVDNKEIATLPMEPAPLSPGEHHILVKRVGYSQFTATVKLKPGAVSEVVAKLEATAGVLSVSSDVVGAEVFVDGASQGPVPVAELLLKPGEHELRVRRDHYDEHVQALSIKAGRDYVFRVNLTPAVTAAVARVDRPERPVKLEPPKQVEPPPRPQKAVSAIPPRQATAERDSGGVVPWYGQWYVWAGAAALAGGAAVGAVALAQPPCTIVGPGTVCWDSGINVPPDQKQYCAPGGCPGFRLPVLRFGGTLPQ